MADYIQYFLLRIFRYSLLIQIHPRLEVTWRYKRCLFSCLYNKTFGEHDGNIKSKYVNWIIFCPVSLYSLAIRIKEKKHKRRLANTALQFNNHLTLEMMSQCKQPHFLWAQKRPLAVFFSCCLAQCWIQTWFPHMAAQASLQSYSFHILVARVLGGCNRRRALFKYFFNFKKDGVFAQILEMNATCKKNFLNLIIW